jgi:ATP-dependent Clp protease protease subunit
MKNSSDFEKFAKSNKINSSYINYYKKNSSNFFEPSSHPTDVFNKLLDDRIIMLTGEVDDYICDLIKAQLLYMESIDSEKDITLYLNSGGGCVYSGLGLVDVMDFVKPDIVTVNTGLAASMAAIILCSGTNGKRKALSRSRTMIHQPMSGFGSYAQASDMEIEAKEINSLKKELYEIISDTSGQSYDKVHRDSDRDYWMTAKETLKYGMIDEIIKKRK